MFGSQSGPSPLVKLPLIVVGLPARLAPFSVALASTQNGSSCTGSPPQVFVQAATSVLLPAALGPGEVHLLLGGGWPAPDSETQVLSASLPQSCARPSCGGFPVSAVAVPWSGCLDEEQVGPCTCVRL